MSAPEPLAAETLEEPPVPSQPPQVTLRIPKRQPWITYSLMGLTVFIYLIQYLTQNHLLNLGIRCPYFTEPDLPACFGLKVNELIIAGQWWRLITPIFLHASLIHIGFNMYALYVLGPELERHFGHLPFLALYMVSGFAGVVFSFLLTQSPSLGASTAVFGLLAAQGVFVFRNQRLFGRRARSALINILYIAVINLLIGLSPGIDDWGHVGGMVGGLIFAGIAGPQYEVQAEAVEYRLVNRTPTANTLLAMAVVGILFTAVVIWRVR